MKKLFGLSDTKEIGIYAQPPIASEVAANSNTPNSETTELKAEQHTAGNGHNN